MKTIWPGLLLLSISWNLSMSQSTQHPPFAGSEYSNATLSFRYVPPAEMRDKTERLRAEIQERMEASHSKDTLGALLAMSSGPDDKATDWHSLTIEIYPRKAVADLDDARAEAKMSAWVANSKTVDHKDQESGRLATPIFLGTHDICEIATLVLCPSDNIIVLRPSIGYDG
jgi:hypothetical protein